jgi:peptide/nickel transport system substrate-binding protein
MSMFSSDYSMVDSIEAVDAQTVRFNLTYPFAAFIRAVGLPGGMIVCPSAVEKWGKDFNQHGCGSGPFMVDKFVQGERMEVVRFNDYWRGPAKLERIIYTYISDEQARISAFIAGEIDLETNIPGPLLPLVKDNPDVTVLRGPAMMVEYIGLNTEDPIFKDKLVRKAIGYAIDMESLIKNVMGGVGVYASQPVSPMAFGYNPNIKPFPYDPEKATELLEEAGWKDTNNDKILEKDGQPFKTKFCIMSIPQMVQFAQGTQAFLKAVGVDATIETLDWGAYLDAASKGLCPIFELGDGANNGDADSVLWMDFHSSMIPASNWTFYNNPAFDDLLKQERQEVDPEKRLELLNKAIEMAVDDAPWIPTWTRENLQAAHNKVKGYELNPSTSYINLYPVWIEQ